MCRAASLVIPGSGGATGLGRRAPLQHRGGPFVPAASAASSHGGKPLFRRRMRNPPDFPFPFTLQPPRGCHDDREGGNVGKTPLATRPRRPCGELHSGSSRFPRTAWALGRWRIPLVPMDLQLLAHARGKCNPPLPRTGKAQVKNKLLCACAQLPPPLSLSPLPGAGDFPLLVRRRGPGFQATRLCYRTKAVAWSFRTCLRNIYFDTVSLYMAQPRFGLTAILLPQNGESHNTWLWSFLFSLQELPSWLPMLCSGPHAPTPSAGFFLSPGDLTGQWAVRGVHESSGPQQEEGQPWLIRPCQRLCA